VVEFFRILRSFGILELRGLMLKSDRPMNQMRNWIAKRVRTRSASSVTGRTLNGTKVVLVDVGKV